MAVVSWVDCLRVMLAVVPLFAVAANVADGSTPGASCCREESDTTLDVSVQDRPVVQLSQSGDIVSELLDVLDQSWCGIVCRLFCEVKHVA
jgi:hypothetical protein